MQLNAKNIASLALLIIALSIGYYFVIFFPQKEQEKINLQNQIQTETENKRNSDRISLGSCLEDAKKTYSANWNSLCKARGKEAQCSLDDSDLSRAEKTLTATKEECFRKYQ